MGPKAILFDFDGTLVDTNEEHIDAWREAFRSQKIYIDREQIRSEIGKGGDQLIPAIIAEEESLDQGDRLRAGHDRAFRRLAASRQFPIFPGAVELLEKLRRRWLTTAIATSSERSMLDAMTANVGVNFPELVDVVVTSSDAANSKPEPDILIAALKKLSLPAHQCIFVGDTVHDAEAARRAGMPFVGLTCGRCATESELMLAGAVAVWRDPAEAMRHLDQMFASASVVTVE